MAPVLIDIGSFGTEIGCIVAPYDHYGNYMKSVCDSIVNAMGFKDVKEYFELFPGQLKPFSLQTNKFIIEHGMEINYAFDDEDFEELNKSPYEKFLTLYSIDYDVCGKIGSVCSQIELVVKDAVKRGDSTSNVFLIPKMDDLRQAMHTGEFDIPISECWFCKDWQKTSGEVD